MKSSGRILLSLLVGLLLLVGAGLGYLGYETFSHTGRSAIVRMNPQELAVLNKLDKITATTTASEVYRLIGNPSESIGGLAKWKNMGGSKVSELRVYFSGGKAQRIRWLKLGSFMYEREL